ncbi:hypothetical protein EGH21_22470 [Halomicroarcula sp. F13]|uniref:Transcription factor zinc-finger domain-containing protein n=1 Tax=Haloarcula rubra TaxID=2487747 RepID=A0AAW4PYV7_9EURY|nr:hypothetical protein [Halomicroarcula rubra]MBX0325786.1 hypothetical protein [Halomicroarcula rubra]
MADQVEPEVYELWNDDESKFICPFCDGRVLRIANHGECLGDCTAVFKRPDEDSLWRAKR